jgi:hypothetical protein
LEDQTFNPPAMNFKGVYRSLALNKKVNIISLKVNITNTSRSDELYNSQFLVIEKKFDIKRSEPAILNKKLIISNESRKRKFNIYTAVHCPTISHPKMIIKVKDAQ